MTITSHIKSILNSYVCKGISIDKVQGSVVELMIKLII